MNQSQWSTSNVRSRGTGRGILRTQHNSTSGRGRGASSMGRGQGVRFNGPTVKIRPTTASSMALQKKMEEMRRRKKEAEQEHFIQNIIKCIIYTSFGGDECSGHQMFGNDFIFGTFLPSLYRS